MAIAYVPQIWSKEVEERFHQFQDDTILFSIGSIGAVALLILSIGPQFVSASTSTGIGLGLICLIIFTFLFRRRSFFFAILLLEIGCFAIVASISYGLGLHAAIFLLILPVGLVGLSLGIRPGIISATAATALLLLPIPLFQTVPVEERLITTVGIWGTSGMIWLALRPLLATIQWAWTSYEQSVSLLDQVREDRAQLHQTLQDLTNVNNQLSRLNQLAQNLRLVAEDERRAKEQFVANVSHELRTPLNMIVGFSEMILKTPQTYGKVLPASLLADLEVILRNSRHLSRLIDDVLDLSQIDAGQMSLVKERTDFVEIVKEAMTSIRPLFESKNLFLKLDIDAVLPPVFCDRTRMQEVMLNLLSNAGRFTEKGGVTVRVWQEEGDLVTSVADTGPGISEDAMKKLFQPFQQLDGSIRRRYGGTGLGLSISKNFVELHDGKMWVESGSDRGAVFCFRFPMEPVANPKSSALRWFNPYQPYQEHRKPSIAPPDIRPRFIVVEQGTALQRLLRRHLDQVDIVPVQNIASALEEMRHIPAKALIVNNIQVGQGLEEVQGLAALPADIPAIICAVPGSDETAVSIGATDYLVKPISKATLISALDRLQRPVKTILVVDDEADAQQLFRRMLSSAKRGYVVLRAEDGVQGLDMLRRNPVDVLLLDLIMPEMDGFQLLAKKNQDETIKDIPTILISTRDPHGQPITSSALAITRAGGLSSHQLLRSIEALTGIINRSEPPAGSKPAEKLRN